MHLPRGGEGQEMGWVLGQVGPGAWRVSGEAGAGAEGSGLDGAGLG